MAEWKKVIVSGSIADLNIVSASNFHGTLDKTLVDGNGIADFSYDGSANATVTVDLDGSTLSLGSSGIKISTGGVGTTQLAADSVTAAKIGDNVINSEHYAAASIDNEHLADNAVDTAEIAADAVTGAEIRDDAIDSEHYVDGSIDAAHIASNAVTTAKINASAKIEKRCLYSNSYFILIKKIIFF